MDEKRAKEIIKEIEDWEKDWEACTHPVIRLGRREVSEK